MVKCPVCGDENVVCTPNHVIYCPCDDKVCEEFTNNFQVAYPKALAGKLCSVCPRFEGCKNK